MLSTYPVGERIFVRSLMPREYAGGLRRPDRLGKLSYIFVLCCFLEDSLWSSVFHVTNAKLSGLKIIARKWLRPDRHGILLAAGGPASPLSRALPIIAVLIIRAGFGG